MGIHPEKNAKMSDTHKKEEYTQIILCFYLLFSTVLIRQPQLKCSSAKDPTFS